MLNFFRYFFPFLYKVQPDIIESINECFSTLSPFAKLQTISEEKEFLKKLYVLFLNPEFKKHFLQQSNGKNLYELNDRAIKYSRKIFFKNRWTVKRKDEKYFAKIFLKKNDYYQFPHVIDSSFMKEKYTLVNTKLIKFANVRLCSDKLYVFEIGSDARIIIFYYKGKYYHYRFLENIEFNCVDTLPENILRKLILVNYVLC